MATGNFSILKWLGQIFGFDAYSEREYHEMYHNGDKPVALPGASQDGIFGGSSALTNVLESLASRLTGNQLTGAEREANAFNAAEAQKSRDFTEYMTRNKYQMETQSMESAGLNPAMVYGGGQLVPTATNGAQGTSVAPSEGQMFDVLSTFMKLPAEIEEIRSAAQRNRDEGAAALETAAAATSNAQSQARQAAVSERIASVQEFRVAFEKSLAESNINVNNQQAEFLAKQAQKCQKEFEQMDDYLAVAQQNADANSKSALAALQSAMAAVRNAATNEYLSSYQSAMMRGQAMLAWAQGEGQNIVNQRLDERTKAEVDKLQKEGVKLDAEKNLIDKEGKKVSAEIVGIYTHAAAEVSEQANNWVTSFVPSMPKIGFK